MVARLHAGHARPHLAHNASALMAEHAREQPFRIEPVQRVGVGVTDARRHDLDQHFARLGAFEIKLDDLQQLLRLERYGCTGLHDRLPPVGSRSNILSVAQLYKIPALW